MTNESQPIDDRLHRAALLLRHTAGAQYGPWLVDSEVAARVADLLDRIYVAPRGFVLPSVIEAADLVAAGLLGEAVES